MCCIWGIERHDLWAKWRAAVGDGCCCDLIVQVGHSKFVDVPGLEGDVPVIVELVIVGAAQPLKVIITPYAIFDRIGDQIIKRKISTALNFRRRSAPPCSDLVI